jgi:hypothetical protein
MSFARSGPNAAPPAIKRFLAAVASLDKSASMPFLKPPVPALGPTLPTVPPLALIFSCRISTPAASFSTD